MTIRESLEQLEREKLSRYASLSCQSKGRKRPESPCDLRPDYQRDRDRILHSKAFRRLKHKTQVFLSPEGDHYRTRLTHTLEVAQIARTIAKSLQLNEDLTEAIALGHDLGHTPFGHSGEAVLNQLCPDGFIHSVQSLRVVDKLEKKGRGLNLTWEVRDGIRNHRTSGHPSTLEGAVVRISDKIAYINHDIDDAVRAGIFVEKDLPSAYTDCLGTNVRDRLNTMVHDLIQNSQGRPEIKMSPDREKAMAGLRQWMFDHVYHSKTPGAEEEKAKHLIVYLYDYYGKHLDRLPEEYQIMISEGEGWQRVVCDYIAGMSDSYAIDRFEELFVPKSWK